jgi:hypothetical protein
LTWEILLETAIGQMGMTLEDFGNMEPWLFMKKLAGFQSHHTHMVKEDWNRVMFTAYAMEINNPYVSKKAATFEQFMARAERGNITHIKTEKELDMLIG